MNIEEINKVIQEVKDNRRTHVNWSGGFILDEELQNFVTEGLSKNTLLLSIDLSGHQRISLEGLKPLTDQLKAHPRVSIVNFNQRFLDDKQSSNEVAEMIRENPRLNVLGLSNTSINIKTIVEVLSEKDTIVMLELADNRIEEESVDALASFLEKSSTLLSIDLSNMFKDRKEDVPKLLTALKENTVLKDLDLSHNLMLDNSIPEKVSAWLKTSPPLETLRFDFSQMKIETVKAIAEVPKHCSHLTKLSLTKIAQSEETGKEMARILAEGLKNNEHLTELCVARNLMGDEGAQCFIDMLPYNHILKSLDLSINKISHKKIEALLNIWQQSNNLQVIHFAPNDLSDEHKEKVNRIVSSKQKPGNSLFAQKTGQEIPTSSFAQKGLSLIERKNLKATATHISRP